MTIQHNVSNAQSMIHNFEPGQHPFDRTFKLSSGPRGLETFYAPFDHINRDADIVICGITPGASQASKALTIAQYCHRNGFDQASAFEQAKRAASFAGPMRKNLCKMLNHIGFPEKVGLTRAEDLFGDSAHRVHHTSALRYPVAKKGENYSGCPRMVTDSYLWDQTMTYLLEEIEALPNALWIPLGANVNKVMSKLIELGHLDERRVLAGLPHPSGANNGRVKYFLEGGGEQNPPLDDQLSKIDQAKASLVSKIAAL